MQKREWVALESQRCGLNKQAGKRATDAVFDTRVWAARTGRSPRAGQCARGPLVRVPVFKPSTPLVLERIRASQPEEGE